jgi:RHS repeat-associated protein
MMWLRHFALCVLCLLTLVGAAEEWGVEYTAGVETHGSYELEDRRVEVCVGAACEGYGVEGACKEYRYDVQGRMVEVTERGSDGEVLRTRYGYDGADRLRRVEGPQGVLEYEYDGLGRMVEERRMGGDGGEVLVTRYGGFTGRGEPGEVVRPNGMEVGLEYDGMGRVLEMRYGRPGRNPLGLWWTKGIAYRYEGDELREVVERKGWPTGEETEDRIEYGYEGGRRGIGWVREEQEWMEGGEERGRVWEADVEEDEEGRIVCVGVGGREMCEGMGMGEEGTRYGYDGRGRVREVRIGEEVTRYEYLEDGRILGVWMGNGTEVRYRYHDEGEEGMDGSERLYEVGHWDGGREIGRMRYGYYEGGKRREEERRLEGREWGYEYEYDGMGRLLGFEERRGGEERRVRYGFVEGRYEREREVVEVGGVVVEEKEYRYNGARQLREVEEVGSGEVVRYWHDGNGNLVRKEGGSGGVMELYYDGADRLIEVGRDGEVLGRYGYDGSWNRIRGRHARDGGLLERGRSYVGREAVEEYGMGMEWGEGVKERYRWGANGLLATEAGGERGYVHLDGKGSVVAVSGMDGGTRGVWRMGVWGETEEGEENEEGLGEQRHGYVGGVRDEETGFVYLGMRYYDPEVGMFVTEDPRWGRKEDPRTQHRHLYGHGDPVGNEDRTGMETVFVGQHGEGMMEGAGAVGMTGYNPIRTYYGGGYEEWLGNVVEFQKELGEYGEVEAYGEYERYQETKEQVWMVGNVVMGVVGLRGALGGAWRGMKALREGGKVWGQMKALGGVMKWEARRMWGGMRKVGMGAWGAAKGMGRVGRSLVEAGRGVVRTRGARRAEVLDGVRRMGHVEEAGRRALGEAGEVGSLGKEGKHWTDFLPEAERILQAVKARYPHVGDDFVGMARVEEGAGRMGPEGMIEAGGFTSNVAGEAFDAAKLARIQASLESQGVTFVTGEEGGRLAAALGGDAVYIPEVGRPGIIAWGTNPSRAAVVEELLHLGQHRALGWADVSGRVVQLEIAAQHKLLQIGARLGWTEAELSQIGRALQQWSGM